MKDFFKGVRKHIGKLDAEHLREQYELVADELAANEHIFHTMSDGFLLVSDTGRVIKSNPAAKRLLGMEPADIVDSLAIPLGKTAKRDLELTYPDDRVLEMKTIPMGAETLVFLRDISAERVRGEEELQAGATKAVRELASGVAHEIGNPLNALALNLSLLQRDHPGDDSIAECRRQVERLDGILKGFLQALRPSRPNLMPGSAAEPLKNCLRTLEHQFEERRIPVTLDIPAALPQVAIDPAQIEQVYFNILKNALEAMKDTDELMITVGSDDNDVTVSFRDTGMGMDAETVAHLFEPYRTSKEHGNGLGLMISKRIITDHGGTIDVVSTAGEGTEFTVRLPRLERRVRRLNVEG